MTDAPCSPGSHPHSDQPNWRPAENAEDYQRNCAEGLETYSDRRMAKLLGISRIAAWRYQAMAEIPEDLLALLQERLKLRPSTKSLAAIGQALRTGKVDGDVELCPHCGEVLRVRSRLSDEAINIVNEWLVSKREATP